MNLAAPEVRGKPMGIQEPLTSPLSGDRRWFPVSVLWSQLMHTEQNQQVLEAGVRVIHQAM